MQSNLYGYITDGPRELDKGEALPDNTLFNLLIGTTAKKGLDIGKKITKNLFSDIQGIWNGRDLIFHKKFEEMTPQEYTEYGKLGKKYYKTNLHNKTFENSEIGTGNFPNSQAGKTDYRYMEQYPFLRYLLKNAKVEAKENNKDRIDSLMFYDLKNKFKGKDYIYQIRKNAYDKTNNFYNIKPGDLDK